MATRHTTWHGRPARGFSILELAIASFIAMIIFTVGFIVITGTLRTRSESTARIRASTADTTMYPTPRRIRSVT